MIDRPFRMSHAAFVFFALLFLFSVINPLAAHAEKDAIVPNWSLEVKGGYFFPEIPDWSTYYGDDKTWQIAASLAYKLIRQIEIGIDVGKIEDRGSGYAPTNDMVAGRVIYQLYPVNAFALVRGVFSEDQWLVPYVGGGFTMIYYREKIEGQGYIRGSETGYHARAGLQLLLDNTDAKAADAFYRDYGIIHTYLFFEAQKTRVMVNTDAGTALDIGGISYLGGLLFEF